MNTETRVCTGCTRSGSDIDKCKEPDCRDIPKIVRKAPAFVPPSCGQAVSAADGFDHKVGEWSQCCVCGSVKQWTTEAVKNRAQCPCGEM